MKVVGRHFGGGQQGAFFVHEEQALPAEVGSSTVSFDVGFQPGAAGEFATELAILTDDDERGVILVPISGKARILPPCDLVVAPSVLRFGLVANRGEHLRSAAIKNVGDDECMIWDVRLATNGFPFFATAGTPTETTVIPAGGRLDLTVRFTPNGVPDVLATSELSFAHTSASAPRMVIPISALPSRYDLEASPNPMDSGFLANGVPQSRPSHRDQPRDLRGDALQCDHQRHDLCRNRRESRLRHARCAGRGRCSRPPRRLCACRRRHGPGRGRDSG